MKLTNNDALGSPGGVAGANSNFAGAQTYGTAYMVNRLLFTGDVDPNVSYIFRLENRYYMETPNYGAPLATTGNSGSAPFYCTGPSSLLAGAAGTGTTCAIGADYPSNESFRLNIAQMTWHSPSGFYVAGGRLVQGDGGSDLGGQPVNLDYSDYFNGGDDRLRSIERTACNAAYRRWLRRGSTVGPRTARQVDAAADVGPSQL